ncbi:methyl-accepting chemotaxis protein [Chitinivorax sp. B]|uniref:methyl-accepting chemotaxis protein n=1 Tax=Chitinivorax sp. B TaxID=2502235 RepID=UPI0010F56E5F|nr:methyl-accepting chemotaxis protein [Chitinivorax sp. B]
MIKRAQTFGQKLAAGYAVMVVLTIIISVTAIYSLHSIVASKDHVIATNIQLSSLAQQLQIASWQRAAWIRGYLLEDDKRYLGQLKDAKRVFDEAVSDMRKLAISSEEQRLIDMVEQSSNQYESAVDFVIDEAHKQSKSDAILAEFNDKVQPPRKQLESQLDMLIKLESQLLAQSKQQANDTVSNIVSIVTTLAISTTVLALVIATILARTLGRQIGAAVGHVQSASAELQAAASQQAVGAKEQAGAMTEISTTISELVATSRQIADSAQRVAQIAEQTAQSARTGDETVEKGQESIIAIRRQMDLVVNHMLDLGRKSQEVGAVLDIVSELAEQTNILAINATIEATGAGEAGRRFAVVADEIRKLADRVASATKTIRTQIDEVRGAVNTTVMATESGAKAVDVGARQFTDVANAFKQIANMVTTTTDAAREIELSTKQQASGAEQVRVAVTDVAQATRESEASSSQTLQTASQLAGLSLELHQLIQPQAA